MTKELQEELKARIFTHKASLIGGNLLNKYIEKQLSKGGANLPEFVVNEQAHEYVQKVLKEAINNGTFETLYNQTWEEIKEVLPEHINVLVNVSEEE